MIWRAQRTLSFRTSCSEIEVRRIADGWEADFGELRTPFRSGTREYLKEFRFRSASEIFFSVFRKVEVPLRANVSEGGIYPCGYRLQFTGHGELDGKTVLNNHVLDREGSRRLILTDNSGKKTEINFTVSKAQTEFRSSGNRLGLSGSRSPSLGCAFWHQ